MSCLVCLATTTASTTTTTTTTTLAPFTCPADGFYEISACIQTYYVCIGGQEYAQVRAVSLCMVS